MHIFKKSKIEKKKNIEQKSMKNRMFFGTSILKAFWEDSMCCAQTAAPDGGKKIVG